MTLHRLVLIGLALWAGAGALEAKFTLAKNGRAQVVILRQAGASPAERRAAEELANTLKAITGATFEIRETDGTHLPAERAIVIGPGLAAARLFPTMTNAVLSGEEYLQVTHGRNLLLAGVRPRGTLYAVERFLQEQCGARWWTPWATTIPKQPNLSVRELKIHGRPAFEYRDPFWYLAYDRDWAMRNGANGQTAGGAPETGGQIVYKGFVHTFYPLVPPEQHFAAHPEWYSLIDGKRTHDHAQLCLSNPELRDFVVERVRAWLRESPEARIVSVSQNDWYGACQCPACRALDEAEGSPAGSLLTFVNYVAERIEPEFPRVAIDTLAYQYTRQAPKTLRPRPNVIVRLCSIECNFAAPLEDPSNAAFARDLRDWSRLCQRLYVWDYTTDFAHYCQPHPNWFVLGANLRFFQRHGVAGVFEQGAYQSHGADMAELRAWVLAQLLWNPNQDDAALIAEFLDGYYGPKAARPILACLKLMATAAQGFNLTCFSSTEAPFLKYETLAQAERLWQQAEAAVANEPERLWRVRMSHQAVRYAWLVRWQSLRREAQRSDTPWPLPTTSRKAVADEWLALATGPGPAGWKAVTHVNESGLTPVQFAARFAVDLPDPPPLPRTAKGVPPPPPADLPNLKPAQCVDVQDEWAELYKDGELSAIRDDPAASDRVAVWMPGHHREWAAQFPVSRLPARAQTGRWQVYAVIRVEKADASDPQSLAFEAGVYDNGNRKGVAHLAPKLGEASENYRAYPLGTVEVNPGLRLWVAPAANAGVRAVWIDRFYLAPASLPETKR